MRFKILIPVLLFPSFSFSQDDGRVQAVLKTSEKVFFASPGADKSLHHLREVIKAGLEASPKFVAFADLGPRLPGRAREEGGVDINENFSTFTITQSEILWQKTQHVYDRLLIIASGHVHVLLRPLPLEMELRGLTAGCVFWDAAAKSRKIPKGASPAGSCPPEIPAQNFCHDNWAVEEVVASWEKLKAGGRTLAQVQKALSAPPDPKDPFGPEGEKNFEAYCAEFERASRGNPLNINRFDFHWSMADCLAQARAAILSEGWRSSWELCPKPDIPDPKYRDIVSAWAPSSPQ